MQISWQFPPNHGGRTDGFNDSAIDTFAGHRLSAVVREVIQNSLDAKGSISEPVLVEFSLKHIPQSQMSDLNGLSEHFNKCLEVAEDNKYEKAQEFYSEAIKRINNSDTVPVLCIHDSNTLGLTGPLKGASGAWVALTKGTGMTHKISGSSLGSYGHGSKAPFSLGHLRSLYYCSKTKNEVGQDELRFQGKSILQSHHHPDTGELTQGTGFYGVKEGLNPLVNHEIPQWACDLRQQHSDGYGTSVIIPHPMFDEGLFPETKITVIANFFYAIKLGLLNVKVNGEIIHKDNVEEVFDWCKDNLEHENDEIDKIYIEDCFKSIDSIVSANHASHSEIPGFGRIDWFIRIADDITTRRVAIARESGMLITRRPHKLLQFQGMKPFEMFVFVNAGEGSKALKVVENPAHDNFEFDRIKGTKNEQNIRNKYDRFTKKIRTILKQYAAVETEEEQQLSELSSFLFDVGSSSSLTQNTERGSRLHISSGPSSKVRTIPKGLKDPGDQVDTTGVHEGDAEGKRGKKSNQGNKEGNGSKHVSAVTGQQGNLNEATKMQVGNIRIIGRNRNKKQIKISFNIDSAGDFLFQLVKTGESETEIVKLMWENKAVDCYKISVKEPGRTNVELLLSNPEDLNLAMEGYIDEIS